MVYIEDGKATIELIHPRHAATGLAKVLLARSGSFYNRIGVLSQVPRRAETRLGDRSWRLKGYEPIRSISPRFAMGESADEPPHR